MGRGSPGVTAKGQERGDREALPTFGAGGTRGGGGEDTPSLWGKHRAMRFLPAPASWEGELGGDGALSAPRLGSPVWPDFPVPLAGLPTSHGNGR